MWVVTKKGTWLKDTIFNPLKHTNLDSSVGTKTGYGLESRGSVPGASFFFLHSVQTVSGAHQDSYPMDTWGDFLGGLSEWGLKLTTRLHLVSKSRMVELYFHSSIRLHAILFN
jgi:hypothetical protein